MAADTRTPQHMANPHGSNMEIHGATRRYPAARMARTSSTVCHGKPTERECRATARVVEWGAHLAVAAHVQHENCHAL
jgi:hypothetical protein